MKIYLLFLLDAEFLLKFIKTVKLNVDFILPSVHKASLIDLCGLK